MAKRSDDTTPAKGATSGARATLTESQIAGIVARLGREVEWSLEVPGRHYSGLTYEALLDILAEQGRPFREDSRTLRKTAIAETSLRLASLRREPTWNEFRDAFALSVLGFIVRRFEAKVRDVRIRALTQDYAKAKARAGYGDRPIGTRTGALSLRVAEYGHVTITK